MGQSELKYEDLVIGMQVIDTHKDEGVISNILDIHNVEVVFTQGGIGLYCFANNCPYNTTKLYKQK